MRLSTRAWGEEGRPLAVLIHGVTASSRGWWRVGPWFAEHGWRAVAVDLRGHGESPRMRGGEGLEDLAEDVRETVLDPLGAGGGIDVLLGHSLGALTALKFCERHGERVRRLVLEDPPGTEDHDFEEVARHIETVVPFASEAPETAIREKRSENPLWAEEDVTNDVLSHGECDAGPVADLVRQGIRYDLPALVGAAGVPTLLVLADESRGSPLRGGERAATADAIRQGTVETFDTGHCVHRDDFEGYAGLLGSWLGEPGA